MASQMQAQKQSITTDHNRGRIREMVSLFPRDSHASTKSLIGVINSLEFSGLMMHPSPQVIILLPIVARSLAASRNAVKIVVI